MCPTHNSNNRKVYKLSINQIVMTENQKSDLDRRAMEEYRSFVETLRDIQVCGWSRFS